MTSQILLGIWQNVPVWVWPLFVVLLAIGIFSMRDRSGSVIPFLFYPLFGFTSLGAITALTHTPLNWITFGIAYLIGAILAFWWQDGLVLSKDRWRVRVRGEKITLIILMAIFFSNFVNGVIEAVAAHIRSLPFFTLIFAGLIGACSGSFTGRGLRIITLSSRKSAA